MPQLRLMRDPEGLSLVLGVMMPPAHSVRRWSVSLATADADGRYLENAAWSVRKDGEHADIGVWFKAVYDHWFNGDPYGLGERAERDLRRIVWP